MANKENVGIWCNYLDGNGPQLFKQGRGALHRKVNGEDEHCCLGVAIKAAQDHGVELKVDEFSEDGDIVYLYDNKDFMLPSAVQQWLGLDTGNPSLRMNDSALFTCISVNDAPDGRNMTFPQIAAALRKKYL